MIDGKKLKILEVCTVPTEKSGIPNVIFNLMRYMPHEDVELGYVAINQPSNFYKTELEKLGARLYIFPRKLFSPWKYIDNLAKVARGYDIIHIHGNSATMVLEMIAAKIAKVKIRAAHSHNSSCRMKTIDRLARPLFHSICNLNLACGEAAGKWLFRNRNFSVINNGINTSKFAFDESKRNRIRESLGLESEMLLGNIANFVDAKNHGFLLEVFAEILKTRKDIRLILLGAGPLFGEMKKKAADMKIEDRVVFAGSVDNPEDYMSAIDYIVMPSKHEGLPLTLVEEQANGLSALVSTEVSNEADLTGNINFLSLKATPEEWADEILSHLNYSKRNRSNSDRAIEKIRNKGYDIKDSVSSLMQIFLQNILN